MNIENKYPMLEAEYLDLPGLQHYTKLLLDKVKEGDDLILLLLDDSYIPKTGRNDIDETFSLTGSGTIIINGESVILGSNNIVIHDGDIGITADELTGAARVGSFDFDDLTVNVRNKGTFNIKTLEANLTGVNIDASGLFNIESGIFSVTTNTVQTNGIILNTNQTLDIDANVVDITATDGQFKITDIYVKSEETTLDLDSLTANILDGDCNIAAHKDFTLAVDEDINISSNNFIIEPDLRFKVWFDSNNYIDFLDELYDLYVGTDEYSSETHLTPTGTKIVNYDSSHYDLDGKIDLSYIWIKSHQIDIKDSGKSHIILNDNGIYMRLGLNDTNLFSITDTDVNLYIPQTLTSNANSKLAVNKEYVDGRFSNIQTLFKGREILLRCDANDHTKNGKLVVNLWRELNTPSQWFEEEGTTIDGDTITAYNGEISNITCRNVVIPGGDVDFEIYASPNSRDTDEIANLETLEYVGNLLGSKFVAKYHNKQTDTFEHIVTQKYYNYKGNCIFVYTLDEGGEPIPIGGLDIRIIGELLIQNWGYTVNTKAEGTAVVYGIVDNDPYMYAITGTFLKGDGTPPSSTPTTGFTRVKIPNKDLYTIIGPSIPVAKQNKVVLVYDGSYNQYSDSVYLVDTTNILPYYTTNEDVKEEINRLINSAPETLDTLKEIAESLNNDPNLYNTLTTAINKKANQTDLTALGGRVTTLENTKANITDLQDVEEVTAAALNDLNSRTSILETDIATKATASDLTGLQNTVNGFANSFTTKSLTVTDTVTSGGETYTVGNLYLGNSLIKFLQGSSDDRDAITITNADFKVGYTTLLADGGLDLQLPFNSTTGDLITLGNGTLTYYKDPDEILDTITLSNVGLILNEDLTVGDITLNGNSLRTTLSNMRDDIDEIDRVTASALNDLNDRINGFADEIITNRIVVNGDIELSGQVVTRSRSAQYQDRTLTLNKDSDNEMSLTSNGQIKLKKNSVEHTYNFFQYKVIGKLCEAIYMSDVIAENHTPDEYDDGLYILPDVYDPESSVSYPTATNPKTGERERVYLYQINHGYYLTVCQVYPNATLTFTDLVKPIFKDDVEEQSFISYYANNGIGILLLKGNDYAIEENVSYTPYIKDKTELYHITCENSIAVLPKQQGNYMDYEPSDNSALITIDLDGAGITYSIPEGITLNNSIFLDSDDDPKTDYLVFTGPVPYKTAVFELIPNCSVPVYAFRESLGGGYDMTGSGRFDFVVNNTTLSFKVEVSIIKGRALVRFNRTSGSATPADDYDELWKLLHKQNIIPETIIPYLNI